MIDSDIVMLKELTIKAKAACRLPHPSKTERIAYISASNLVVMSPELFIVLMEKIHNILTDTTRRIEQLDWLEHE